MHQNLNLMVVWILRMGLARVGSPNCELPTTVFTAVFCTRLVYDYLLARRTLTTLSV